FAGRIAICIACLVVTELLLSEEPLLRVLRRIRRRHVRSDSALFTECYVGGIAASRVRCNLQLAGFERFFGDNRHGSQLLHIHFVRYLMCRDSLKNKSRQGATEDWPCKL